MVKVEETGTSYTNGTYEIEKEANHLHIARFLSPEPPAYLFRRQDMGNNPGGGFGNMLFLETGGRKKHSAFSNLNALGHFRRPAQRQGHKRTLAPVWEVVGGNVGFAYSNTPANHTVTVTSLSFGIALSPIIMSIGFNIGRVEP